MWGNLKGKLGAVTALGSSTSSDTTGSDSTVGKAQSMVLKAFGKIIPATKTPSSEADNNVAELPAIRNIRKSLLQALQLLDN